MAECVAEILEDAFDEWEKVKLARVFEDESGVAEFSAGRGLGFGGAEAELMFEIGAHSQMGLNFFRDVGVHPGAPEQSAPNAFHTYLRMRATPFETLSQLVSASSRRWRPVAVSL